MPPFSAAGEPDRLEILDERGRDVIGLWRNVLVAAVRSLPDADLLHRIHAIQGDVAGRFPRGFSAMVILPGLSPLSLTSEVRAAAERMTNDAAPQFLGLAQVIEGRGFVTAAIRSIATGMVLGTQPPWPMRIFAGIEPAAAWLAAWVEGETRPAATRKLTEALRQTLVWGP